MHLPKKILYAWEWGAGSSHWQRFSALARRLEARGSAVIVVGRDLTHARRWFPQPSIALYQSPTLATPAVELMQDPRSLASIAWNLGYSHAGRTHAWLDAWLEILRGCKPDLVIGDFGLMPFVAAGVMNIPIVRMGVGFECPPNTNPLSCFGEPLIDSVAEGTAHAEVLKHLNQALHKSNHNEIESIGSVLPTDEATVLCTVVELDPYAKSRATADYLGWWDNEPRDPVQWPGYIPVRALAYLKPFPAISQFFRALRAAGVEVALVSDGIPNTVLHELAQGMVTVQRREVDFHSASRESNFVITNGNLGATFTALANGCPVLICPRFIEQRLTANAIHAQRLGVAVNVQDPQSFAAAIREILTNPCYRESARRFQEKYIDQRPNAANALWDRLMTCIQRVHPAES